MTMNDARAGANTCSPSLTRLLSRFHSCDAGARVVAHRARAATHATHSTRSAPPSTHLSLTHTACYILYTRTRDCCLPSRRPTLLPTPRRLGPFHGCPAALRDAACLWRCGRGAGGVRLPFRTTPLIALLLHFRATTLFIRATCYARHLFVVVFFWRCVAFPPFLPCTTKTLLMPRARTARLPTTYYSIRAPLPFAPTCGRTTPYATHTPRAPPHASNTALPLTHRRLALFAHVVVPATAHSDGADTHYLCQQLHLPGTAVACSFTLVLPHGYTVTYTRFKPPRLLLFLVPDRIDVVTGLDTTPLHTFTFTSLPFLCHPSHALP